MSAQLPLKDTDVIRLNVPCIRATQPVGDLYVAAMPHNVITKIAFFDVRRRLQEERDVERYLGIQRPLNPRRVTELQSYVNHFDASFPTSVIIAVSEEYVSYNEISRELILSNVRIGEEQPSIAIRQLARVIDGQHRIASLIDFGGTSFDLPVTVFVGADIADQAHIFATVNLEQTKVSKSLAYDLYELAKSRSPQKTCHNVSVALDQDSESPLFHRIKRLGLASSDREFEPITQATFVESLIKYISKEPMVDRDTMLRGRRLVKASATELMTLPLRNMFIEEADIQIAQIVFNYFAAVKHRWPKAWDARGRGYILNRTNGFRALMRAFGKIYLDLVGPGEVAQTTSFRRYFDRVEVDDDQFNTENFPPGSSGEARLFRILSREDKAPNLFG